MVTTFGALVQVVPSAVPVPVPAAPQKAITHTYHSVPELPNDFDLDSIEWGARLNGPRSGGNQTRSGMATPSGNHTPLTALSESHLDLENNVEKYQCRCFAQPLAN